MKLFIKTFTLALCLNQITISPIDKTKQSPRRPSGYQADTDPSTPTNHAASVFRSPKKQPVKQKKYNFCQYLIAISATTALIALPMITKYNQQ